MPECLCGHHTAIDCPSHGPMHNRMRAEDMIGDADDIQEYHDWLDSVEIGGEA